MAAKDMDDKNTDLYSRLGIESSAGGASDKKPADKTDKAKLLEDLADVASMCVRSAKPVYGKDNKPFMMRKNMKGQYYCSAFDFAMIGFGDDARKVCPFIDIDHPVHQTDTKRYSRPGCKYCGKK